MMAYKAIKNEVERVINSLRQHAESHSKKYYAEVRKQRELSCIEEASRFIYLNKTCFNGLYRVNSKGEFNVPMGKYKNPLICDAENLRNVSKSLQNTKLSNLSFEHAKPRNGDVVYCDPPYDETYNQYTAGRFDAGEQQKLADKAKEWADKGAKVIISNANTPLVRELYKSPKWLHEKVVAPRNISCIGNDRQPIIELIITNA